MSPEYRKLVSVSTGHLQHDDLNDPERGWARGANEYPALAAPHEYGLFIYVGSADDWMPEDYPHLSAEFFSLCLKLCKAGVEYVTFDCDAPTIEGVPTFDW